MLEDFNHGHPQSLMTITCQGIHLCAFISLWCFGCYSGLPILVLKLAYAFCFHDRLKVYIDLVDQRFLHNTSDPSQVYVYLMFSSLCTAASLFLSLIMFSWSPKCWMEKSVYCWQLFIPGVTYLCWLFFSGDALFLLYTMPLEVWSLKVLMKKNAISIQKGHLFW